MALKDLLTTFLEGVLRVGEDGGAVRDEAGSWWLAGSGKGRVRIQDRGPSDAWVEVAHVAAVGVENWTPRLWEEANEATLMTPAHTVMIGDRLVVRMVVNGFEVTPEAIDRAINLTWQVSQVLGEKVVVGLGIGSCPDAGSDTLVDGGATPLALDLGLDAGIGDRFAAGAGPVAGGLAAATAVVPGGAAGYL